jgi:putative oxidoreductase
MLGKAVSPDADWHPTASLRGRRPSFSVERIAIAYGRIALGTAFLSAVASRFGVWNGHRATDSFREFIAYTAQVNAFLPSSLIPRVAVAATVCETILGVALILGVQRRVAAFCSAVLLLFFGLAMAISQGVKEPLDYSVFSASAAALLLALPPVRAGRSDS